MSDVLSKIDASLEDVEEQLLNEFNRFRAGLDQEWRLDSEIKGALEEETAQLAHRLEHSGDVTHLALRTDRHDMLRARMLVVQQLLRAHVPGHCIHDVHEELENARRRLERRVSVRRRKLAEEGGEPPGKDTTLVKGLFGREAGRREIQRNRLRVTEEEEQELQDVGGYLDSGIYSASRELAMLANLVQRGATDKPPERRGRAIFEARELTTRPPPTDGLRPVNGAEQATRKPAAGPDAPAESPPQKEDKTPIGRTPEEIRKKLASRAYQSPGKASFVAKDIEPAHGSPFDLRTDGNKAADKEEEKEESPKSGKAIFEARDLSESPWKKD